jgi:hypothetical protein
MNLTEKLSEIKKELIPISPKKILNDGVNKKIGRTERTYKKAIEENCRYILSRSSYKALMCIDRYNRKKEKMNGKETNYGFIETI